jgi:hypothetical protein
MTEYEKKLDCIYNTRSKLSGALILSSGFAHTTPGRKLADLEIYNRVRRVRRKDRRHPPVLDGDARKVEVELGV